MLRTAGMQTGDFSHIFIDESSQAMEPELLVPISFAAPAGNGPHARPTAVVLAGDHCQLGPAVRSAAAAPLEKSLMERLVCLGTLGHSPEPSVC